jgi:DNA-binding XRE family transcriptional regulator
MPKRTPQDWETLERDCTRPASPRRDRGPHTRTARPARGHQLAQARKQLGLTQRGIASAMSVSVARVSQIEHGDVTSFEVIARYVEALGGALTWSPTSAAEPSGCLPQVLQDQCEVVQAGGYGGVVGPVGCLGDGQCPLLQRPRRPALAMARCGRCSALSKPGGSCSPTQPPHWPAAPSSHHRYCHSTTPSGRACSAWWTSPASGPSCCWPECTRCGHPRSAPSPWTPSAQRRYLADQRPRPARSIS